MKRISVFILLFFVLLFNIQAQTYTLCEKWVDCGNACQLLDPYYSDGVTFTWDGSVKNGKANGYGVATKYKNGQFESKYEGIYKNGIREDKGQFTHADGSIKTGHFVNGQLVGQGKMTTEDGHTYDGCDVSVSKWTWRDIRRGCVWLAARIQTCRSKYSADVIMESR